MLAEHPEFKLVVTSMLKIASIFLRLCALEFKLSSGLCTLEGRNFVVEYVVQSTNSLTKESLL